MFVYKLFVIGLSEIHVTEIVFSFSLCLLRGAVNKPVLEMNTVGLEVFFTSESSKTGNVGNTLSPRLQNRLWYMSQQEGRKSSVWFIINTCVHHTQEAHLRGVRLGSFQPPGAHFGLF